MDSRIRTICRTCGTSTESPHSNNTREITRVSAPISPGGADGLICAVNRNVTVTISERAAERLAELARRELRAPRQQAALLLVEAIERAARRRPAAGSHGRLE